MPNTPAGMRECPTRADGERGLFAHVIDVPACQERQRRHFHKCPSCTHCNARNGVRSTDELPKPKLPERRTTRTLIPHKPTQPGPTTLAPRSARPA